MYVNKLPALLPSTKAAAVQVLTSATNIANFIALAKVQVKRVSFVVTVATVSSGGIVLTFYKRPTAGGGVTTGQTSLGTITIPAAAVAGAVYYLDISGATLQPGEALECDVTTAAAGGGAAGSGYFLPQEIEEAPDAGPNYSNATKVTV